jgi:hypothetical protein
MLRMKTRVAIPGILVHLGGRRFLIFVQMMVLWSKMSSVLELLARLLTAPLAAKHRAHHYLRAAPATPTLLWIIIRAALRAPQGAPSVPVQHALWIQTLRLAACPKQLAALFPAMSLVILRTRLAKMIRSSELMRTILIV